MTEAEIRAIVDKLADIAAVLHDADPRAIPLSQSEGMVMRHLQADPAPPPGCVAAATGLQRTNPCAVLHGLERKGLIERHASPGDRRGMIVRAAQHGRPTARCGRPPR